MLSLLVGPKVITLSGFYCTFQIEKMSFFQSLKLKSICSKELLKIEAIDIRLKFVFIYVS